MRKIRIHASLIVVALNLLVVAWAGLTLRQSRAEVERRVEEITRTMALTLDQSITDSLHRIDLTLLSLVDELERRSKEKQRANPAALDALLEKHRGRVPELVGIRVGNAAGDMVGGVGGRIGLKYEDRDYFAHHRDNVDGKLFIGKPVLGPLSKIWLIPFTRRYNRSDGSFGGVVVASLPIAHLTQLLSTLNFTPRGSAILRDADTGLITRHPLVAGPAGQIDDKSYSREIGELFESGVAVATYHTRRAADGVERTNSFRRLHLVPFTVIVGLASEDYLTEWRNEARKVAALLALFAVATIAAAWVIVRLIFGQMRAGASLEEANRQLRATLNDLRQRDNALTATQEVGRMGVYTMDAASGTWNCSPELKTLLGMDVDPATLDDWLRIVHPDDRLALESHLLDQVLVEHSPFDKDFRIVRPLDGKTLWVRGYGKLEFDSTGNPLRITGAIQDVSERRQVLDELDRIAHFDPLTGVPNRRLLADRLQQAVARARRSRRRIVVCYLDLDGFKPINDQYGHEAGDRLLTGVTRHLQGILRADDTIARLGGDEFVLLLNDLETENECRQVLDRILATASKPVDIGEASVAVSASIGVTSFPPDEDDADALLRHADQAMYRAKDCGKNRYQFYASSP